MDNPIMDWLNMLLIKAKSYIVQNGKKILVTHLDFDAAGFKNSDIVLTKVEILNNIHKVQTDSNIKLSNELVDKLGHCQLDIEMENWYRKNVCLYSYYF